MFLKTVDKKKHKIGHSKKPTDNFFLKKGKFRKINKQIFQND